MAMPASCRSIHCSAARLGVEPASAAPTSTAPLPSPGGSRYARMP
jgi:hypothetical protein